MIIENESYTLTFDDSIEARNKAFEILKSWFMEHELFTGESIQQMDITYETAPNLLTDLAEKAFCFETKWK